MELQPEPQHGVPLYPPDDSPPASRASSSSSGGSEGGGAPLHQDEPGSAASSSSDSGPGGGAPLESPDDVLAFVNAVNAASLETPADLRDQVLPLRSISLATKPFNKRAVAWSCDAELAVAADDSVHVLVPEFPDPFSGSQGGTGSTAASRAPAREEGDGDDNAAAARDPLVSKVMLDPRQQFFEGSRQFPITYPPLNPLINRHVWRAAGLPSPLIDTFGGGRGAAEGDRLTDDDYSSEGEGGAEPGVSTGAGAGVISSVGSTMNHVVAVEWSPSGLGRNRRPVLAVLGAGGVLAVYGEGGPGLGSGLRGLRVGRKGTERDLAAWVALWAVGERFVVPGQDEYGERVVAFAWSREVVGPGRALLAYMNDQREVVVVAVGAEYKTGKERAQQARWHVSELLRTKFEGPHPVLDFWDPDWTPFGSCYCIRWSPWLKEEGAWTCLLSHMDKSYIGFRKVTLQADWQLGSKPEVHVDTVDWDGKCHFLSTDAFLEFEDTILTVGDDKICRGVIASPFKAVPFQVSLTRRNRDQPWASHPTSKCGTTYRSDDDTSSNPIMGLVVHQPDARAPAPTALYTLVRLAATATNDDWYETNDASAPRPQWATEVAQRVRAVAPADMTSAQQEGAAAAAAADDDGVADYDDTTAATAGSSGGDGDEDDDDDDDDGFAPPGGEDVYPTRMRLWGLAASPGGGGCTAVLGTLQMTQFPERGGWHSSRSRLMFGLAGGEGGPGTATAPAAAATATSTTEARLFEWMYGGGPGVPGVTGPAEAAGGGAEEDAAAARRRETLRAMFGPLVAAQRCDVCGTPIRRAAGGRHSVCEKGHVYDTCGASGLAIQEPGISRACGVCRSRCLDVEQLVRVLPGRAELIRQEVTGDVCTRCGGKYLD